MNRINRWAEMENVIVWAIIMCKSRQRKRRIFGDTFIWGNDTINERKRKWSYDIETDYLLYR